MWVWGETAENKSRYAAEVDDGVNGAAKEVEPDGKCVNVVHPEVVWNEKRKHISSEHEGDDSHSDARCSGEKPDQNDE